MERKGGPLLKQLTQLMFLFGAAFTKALLVSYDPPCKTLKCHLLF
jgi:hypothetical protein